MFKIDRIFTKVFISMFLAIAFCTLLFSIYYITSQKKEVLKSMQLEAKSISKMIIYSTSDAIVLNDGSYIVEFNYDFLSQNELLQSIIIAKSKKEFFIIKKESWELKESLDNRLKNLESKYENASILYDPVLNTDVFHYVSPIKFSGSKWGYIHLSFSLEEYNEKISSIYFSFFFFLLLMFLISFLISYFIAKNFTTPIVKLNALANEISKGRFDLRSDYKSDDEIGHLSNSFNEMISEIQLSHKQLKESHEKLEERVEKRTLQLNNTNKELEEKSSELEQLNNLLDKKVKEEVEKRTSQERMLIQQSRLAAMGEMIGNIAHQWRQPLSVITTAASGIKLEKEFGIINEETEHEKIDTIVKTSNYLSNTIEDFSNFFKPNKIEEDFFIAQKVKHALELVNSSLKYHHIEVIENLDDSIEIYGFSNEYAQAVLNILTNAKDVLIEREVSEPKIYISIYQSENISVLEIGDNAGGIENSIIDKIFEPYFTTKHKSRGTGIGLYMSKMIIEQNMKGSLSVKNSKDGAVFSITVPVS